MTEQYRMGVSVMDYLESLELDMITIGRAICDKNLERSYQLIKENPNISKEEFLTAMGIEEWEEHESTFPMQLTKAQELLIRGLKLFPMAPQEREKIFQTLKTDEERWALMTYMKENRNATAQEIKEEVSRIIE